jgi:hypothetical protein
MNSERRDSLGYECSCHVFTDPKESLCRFCLPRREEWEDERAREQAEIDLESDAQEPRYEFVYEPPRTPKGDVDYRKEVEWWKGDRAKRDILTYYPLDSLILIDNLLAAIDKAREERDEALRQVERLWEDCTRLMNERNEAMKERDKARSEAAMERLARLDEELGLQ